MFIIKNRNFVTLIILLALCFILLILQNSTATQVPQKIGMNVSMYGVDILHTIESFFVNTVNSINELRDLHTEYNELLRRFDEQRGNFQNLELLQKENHYLRELLEYSQFLSHPHLPAQIIGKDPGVHFSSFLINKGNRHGIKPSMPVVAFQDGYEGLIGHVVEIGWNSALIRPLIHPESFVSARLSKTRYEGLVRGVQGDPQDLIMEYLDRNSRNEISVGDEVITAGLQSLYPPNILIGTVNSISSTSYAASLELDIRPFINFTRLEHVFVLLTDGLDD
ncbi:MAG: rod shape-determining protein MreC [Salinispira sp.]